MTVLVQQHHVADKMLSHCQGFSGNSLYAVPGNLDLVWKEELSVMEFPRENLQFREKLGEGQFGEVGGLHLLGL